MDELNVETFSFVNVCDDPGEVKMRDVDFDKVAECCVGHKNVLALGGTASTVLKRLGVDHFRLPHPSPRNRLLNSKEYEMHVLRECKEYIYA